MGLRADARGDAGPSASVARRGAPDDRNDLGETALHVAAARGNDEAVQLLLRHGADLLAADWVCCVRQRLAETGGERED